MTLGRSGTEVQIQETKFSLSRSLDKLKDLNTLLGGRYACIKLSNALSEPSVVGLLPWRQPKCHHCHKPCHNVRVQKPSSSEVALRKCKMKVASCYMTFKIASTPSKNCISAIL